MERRFRRNLYEIPIAFIVLRQNKKMVVLIALRRSAMVIFLADIKLASEERRNSGVLGRVVEGHCTKNVAMGGHGDRTLPKLANALDQLIYIAGAIQK